MPDIKVPEVKVDEVVTELTKALKDVVYVTVGFGVLAFQKAQVQRQEMQKTLGSRVDAGRTQWDELGTKLQDQLKTVDDRLDEVERKLDSAFDQLQAKLPEQASELLVQARDVVKSARDQVLELVRREQDEAA